MDFPSQLASKLVEHLRYTKVRTKDFAKLVALSSSRQQSPIPAPKNLPGTSITAFLPSSQLYDAMYSQSEIPKAVLPESWPGVMSDLVMVLTTAPFGSSFGSSSLARLAPFEPGPLQLDRKPPLLPLLSPLDRYMASLLVRGRVDFCRG